MKKKYVLILALAVLTALCAVVRFANRETIPENAIAVTYAEQTRYLDVTKLPLVPVRGTIVNGKGKETTVDTMGISLADAVKRLGVDEQSVEAVIVTAQDEFSARISGEELREAGKAYLISNEEGMMLVVFGDANAKRKVHQVMRIDLQ